MVQLGTLANLLGCEEQEKKPSAWEDVDEVVEGPEEEAAEVVKRFGLEVYEEDGVPVGVVLNKAAYFDGMSCLEEEAGRLADV